MRLDLLLLIIRGRRGWKRRKNQKNCGFEKAKTWVYGQWCGNGEKLRT